MFKIWHLSPAPWSLSTCMQTSFSLNYVGITKSLGLLMYPPCSFNNRTRFQIMDQHNHSANTPSHCYSQLTLMWNIYALSSIPIFHIYYIKSLLMDYYEKVTNHARQQCPQWTHPIKLFLLEVKLHWQLPIPCTHV
jgi:hypothetical protein